MTIELLSKQCSARPTRVLRSEILQNSEITMDETSALLTDETAISWRSATCRAGVVDEPANADVPRCQGTGKDLSGGGSGGGTFPGRTGLRGLYRPGRYEIVSLVGGQE